MWRVRAPLDVCWGFLTSPGQRWLDWWPWLESIDVRRSDGLVGSTAHCVWKSPVGFRLSMTVRLNDADPSRRVDLVVTGDVAGTAVVRFCEAGDGTRIDVAWQVTTERAWMNVTGPLLWPVFTWGHRVVMNAGERGLNAMLAGH
ncbi:hypothetical protein [Phytoactinopolyspora alkaliphila]|uniref:hypothetical protein n=1 Tax=Phytoactinopolyspora alkaliphila TaxID=1783498 RepID=UPI001C2048E7|nr:hypothetical protein [Phytoactinopolyspora alkaliphila]